MKRRGGLIFLQLSVRDLLTQEDFALLTIEARGLLFDLILRCASNGSVPASPAELGRIIGAPTEKIAELLPTLSGFVAEKSGRLDVPMLDIERRRVRERSEKKARGGRESGKRRREAAIERKQKQEYMNTCSTIDEVNVNVNGNVNVNKCSGGPFGPAGTHSSDALLENPVPCTDPAGAPDAALAVGALASGAGCFEDGDPYLNMTPTERAADRLKALDAIDFARVKLSTAPRGALDELTKAKLVEYFAAGPSSENFRAGLHVLRRRCAGKGGEWYERVAADLAAGNHQNLSPIERFDLAVAAADEALRAAKEA